MATDLELLVRDKYEGDTSKVTQSDKDRLAAGEPLAYVIGWIPFLDLRIYLECSAPIDSPTIPRPPVRALIPRPETEWWTELLIAQLRERFGDKPFSILDLCAGSGAIGLSILAAFPTAHVSFAELVPELTELIQKNSIANNLDTSRVDIRESNLFSSFESASKKFDCIATNPPYIPSDRIHELDARVTTYEPHEALFAGDDGLSLIRKIADEASAFLKPDGEMWLECDSGHAEHARALLEAGGAERATVFQDLYGRPRLVVAYYT